ncbi:hypothetical protein C5C71_16340 [Rathayibacter sp. AY1C1]|jgi:hypothetical protein|uniref:S8 family peptidase n=1 Tax=Rathayibacter sp. AY1C1 TaxID=2080534 RepID=UPI000CE7FB14|nr:S8 family peptidase [Rathayibacter sp. AY1C1]PPH05948.1 hypothetical protein C5C71_16340 [Rathayibacter sp. AY1C1]
MAESRPGNPLLVNGEALRLNVTPPKSGGGTKYNPQKLDAARALLVPMVEQAVKSVAELPIELRADRVYLEARLLPNYISASSFPTDLLAQIGAVPVGSRADVGVYKTKTRKPKTVGTRRIIVSVDDSGLAKLGELTQSGGTSKEERKAVEDDLIKFDFIALSEPATPNYAEESRLWEAVLHPEPGVGRAQASAGNAVLDKWSNWIRLLDGKVNDQYIRRVGGLTFTSVELPPEALVEARRFNPLRVIRPMPQIRPFPGVQLRDFAPFVAAATDRPRSEKFRVAVFDGGLGRTTPLFPDASIDLTSAASTPHAIQHGTAVTGATMYGLANPGEGGEQLALPVDSFRVLPPPIAENDPDGYWVLDQIRNIVERGEHKIVNLSLGPAEPLDDDQEPNLWTSTLDQLAWEKDVLFVVAAGNHGDQDELTGLDRIEAPADMANGLSVGAVDKPAPQKKWARAPYSSKGPGRQGNRIQPTGVQFGGVADQPFPILRADGSFGASQGTSFAAPLVTHALSGLAASLPVPTPSVLRAFVAHFTERHTQYKKRRAEFGYGRIPLKFDSALESSEDEAHVLYVDSIERDVTLGFQIPVPTRHQGPVEISVTLAFASSVDPAEPTDYTRGTLDLVLRPHSHRFVFHAPKDQPSADQILDDRSPAALDLLEHDWTQGGAPLTAGLGAGAFIPEHQLRDEGKWETLRHARLKLKPGEVEDPWVEVSYVARRAGSLDLGPSTLPFCLLVTVRDTSGTGTLYRLVTTQFQALKPLVQIASQVRVK